MGGDIVISGEKCYIHLTFPNVQVEYNRHKMDLDARLKKAVITNLNPDTSYDFKITAAEGNMGGLRHRITAKTSPPITIRRPEIDPSRRETEATVTIILPLLETRTPVKYVLQLIGSI